MKYGKDTPWLKGIEFGREPEVLSLEQLERGIEILDNVNRHFLPELSKFGNKIYSGYYHREDKERHGLLVRSLGDASQLRWELNCERLSRHLENY